LAKRGCLSSGNVGKITCTTWPTLPVSSQKGLVLCSQGRVLILSEASICTMVGGAHLVYRLSQGVQWYCM
jgi:hypothetical protein